MKNIIDYLKDMAMDKIDDTVREVEIEKEFIEQQEIIDNLKNTLEERLGKEEYLLVKDLEDELNNYSGALEIRIYLQGLKDGMKLDKILNS